MNPIGANTWIWVSPPTDERLAELAPRIRGWGFDVIEIPIEQPGDWDPGRTAELLAGLGLGATTCAVMPDSRSLVSDDRSAVEATQAYLRTCVDHAARIGASVVGGPIYAPVGWTPLLNVSERRHVLGRLVEALRGVAEYAASRGVTLAIEPLNRYETSIVNTVEQAREIVEARRLARVRDPGRHVPYQHRGARPCGRDPARRRPAGTRPGLRQRSRRPGRGPHRLERRTSPRSARSATAGRCASSRSPPRTRRSRAPPPSGVASHRRRTPSRPTALPSCAASSAQQPTGRSHEARSLHRPLRRSAIRGGARPHRRGRPRLRRDRHRQLSRATPTATRRPSLPTTRSCAPSARR